MAGRDELGNLVGLVCGAAESRTVPRLSGAVPAGRPASQPLSQSHSPGSMIADGPSPPMRPAGGGGRREAERDTLLAAAAGAGARVDAREAAVTAFPQFLAAASLSPRIPAKIEVAIPRSTGCPARLLPSSSTRWDQPPVT